MGTDVVYNGITITNCLTRQFDQQPVYDDSHTDLLYHKFTISVVGQLHNQAVVAGSVDVTPRVANTSTAYHERAVRRKLLHPRGSFSMFVGNNPILQAIHTKDGSVTESADVNNGPKPLGCRINKIIGSAAMEIEFTIEICIVDCADLYNRSGVLNNRWSMSDDYDQDFYCTRTIEGTLRIASAELNVHAFRAWVFPPLQLGFRREKIAITSSPDQLSMRYTITDRQVYAAAPAPATTWTGTLTMLTNDGINTSTSLAISMTGSPGSNKRAMLENALTIARARIFKRFGADSVLQSASIVDHLESSSIEASWQFSNVIDVNAIQGFALNDLRIGVPIDAQDLPGYNRYQSRVPKIFGEATPVGLFVSFLQSPCDNAHAVPQTTAAAGKTTKPKRGTEKPEVETSEGDVRYDPTISTNYSQSHKQAIYTFYQIDVEYPTDTLTVQLPISSTNPKPGADTAAFVSLGGGITQRIIRVAAERSGKPPEMPNPVPILRHGKLVMRLLKHNPKPKAPKLEADGKTLLYSMDAEYVYGLNRPPLPGENVPIAVLPWITGPPARMPLSSRSTARQLI